MNDRIRQLRKALGLSQQEFAARIGRKQSAVSYLEKNGSTATEQNITLHGDEEHHPADQG
ncbi:helix-turn-helix domain-containing protein, partial [Bittarella massiliensis (ex Durand et al. 2017)]|uniref:helix-turn-helix domain-containing protein n=1 Tax=Bittarella massiliensis (ex Durand et al. 2017) TaxID=1720313 RepID=UPI0034A03696